MFISEYQRDYAILTVCASVCLSACVNRIIFKVVFDEIFCMDTTATGTRKTRVTLGVMRIVMRILDTEQRGSLFYHIKWQQYAISSTDHKLKIKGMNVYTKFTVV